jgi:hypothetical protein
MRWALAIAACASCGDNLTALGPLTGLHEVDVAQPDGTTDHVYLAVAQPIGPGPFPVVVFAHGLSISDFANCAPTDIPPIGGVADLVVDLAEHGYLGIAVMYRNVGDRAPGIGKLALRDLHLRDARAILEGARWARANTGPSPVALWGTSYGAFPTLWAVGDPSLDRNGLDLRTAIVSGQTGNAIATLASVGTQLASSDDIEIKGAVFFTSVFALQVHASALDLPVVGEGDTFPGSSFGDALSGSLTVDGAELARQLAFEPANEQLPPTCQFFNDVPPICDPQCLNDVALSSPSVAPADLLRPPLVDALTFWQPPARVDPGAASANPVLAQLRAVSPAYALAGPLAVGRVLILASQSDVVIDGDALDQLRSRLTASGATVVPGPMIDRDDSGACAHEDYIDTTRLACGYGAVLDELATSIR